MVFTKGFMVGDHRCVSMTIVVYVPDFMAIHPVDIYPARLLE